MNNRYVVLISLILIIIAIFSFINSPFFQIRHFSITENKILSENELLDYLKNYENQNLLFLNEAKIKNRLKKQENYIKEVFVEKYYPDKLEVEIIERKPLAKIINDGVALVFDKEGIILESNKNKLRASVPLIKGIGYFFRNNKIEFTKELKNIVNELANVEMTLINDINLIQYNKENNNEKKELIFYIFEDVQVYLGNIDNLSKKMSILEATMKKIKNEGLKVDYVNLKYPEKPVYKIKD